MNPIYIFLKNGIQGIIPFLFLIFIPVSNVYAQDDCEISKDQDQGYTTSITSVTENGDNTHTIVLTVEHNGCASSDCKALNQYSIEAEAGTYSDISVVNVEGGFSYGGINLGPGLGGVSFDGFRVSGISGIGNGQAGAFTITYTLSGGLQDQQTMAKTSNKKLYLSFMAEEFQSVLDCATQKIFPYYNPPEGGKNDDLIGAELWSLYNTYITYDSVVSNDIFQIIGTSDVIIEIHAVETKYNELLTLLKTPSYGLSNEVCDPVNLVITGQYPIANLLLLNDLPLLVNYARPVYPAIANIGLVTSQGDTAMRSYIARGAFNIDGSGVKVGVLSDSYNNKLGNPAADDILKGDLPGFSNPYNQIPVHVLKEYPYGSGSDEGRAMLQIVHDIAPGAELAFRTGFLSAIDFADGIKELQAAGCDVIVDDITYITEPFLQDGIVARAVNAVADSGVAYFSAAGNFGNRSYQTTFSSSAAPTGITGVAHDFTGGSGSPDIYQSISLTEGDYTIVLQWDDGSDFASTNTDLDIYLSSDNGTTLFGFNRINTGGMPIEVLPFRVTDSAQTNILIVKDSGLDDVYLKYVVFRGNITFNEYNTNGSSTIVGQANAEGAMAVGAVLYSNTPEYGVGTPTIASFSSVGGTPVDGVVRDKPEISAPNGVNTSVDLGGFDIDGDPFPNFFGTSAAAPHAAGVAALLFEAKSNFYGTTITPDEVRTILQSTAIEMGSPGHDASSGYGFIQADAALLSLASPSPVISSITYDTTSTPGLEPVNISIAGNYLTPDSEIYFNGLPVDSGTVISGDTLITGIIGEFEDRYPPIQVYNPPNAMTNGTDGGLSNPLYFTTKRTIVTTIHSKSKIYGEIMPEFTASFAVESIEGSISLEEEGLSADEIARIQSVGLLTVATVLSNSGIWEIVASSDDPLHPQSMFNATDSLDISLLERYNFDFERGLLTIQKMDLLIIPKDTTITYGDTLTGFEYDYVFNSDLVNPEQIIPLNSADSLAILNAVKQSHATALVNAVGKVKATALVNDEGDPMLDSATLVNKSVVVSNAVFAGKATALVNGTLIDPGAFLNAALSTPATALVNGIGAVRATALVNGTATALVNGQATALVNLAGLSHATALVNTTTVSETNNEGAIMLLGEGDISILAGDSTGSIELNSISLITGDDAGEHLIVPGSFLSINFNITYGLGKLEVEKDTAEIFFDPLTLIQTYDGSPKVVTATTLPDSVAIQITYDGDTIAPTNAGTYAVFATVTDPNYEGTASCTLTIEKALAAVTITNLTQTYSGNPTPVTVETSPEPLSVEVLYNDETTEPVNAGTYLVVATIDDPNYYGSATETLTIDKALASVSIGNLVQTYSGNAIMVSIETVPESLNVEVLYDADITVPVNAGTYIIDVAVVDPNYFGSATETLTVEKAEVSITLGSLIQTYSGSPLSVTTEPAPEFLTVEVLYDGELTAPTDAGVYNILATVVDLNYFGSTTGILTIEKAVATVTLGGLSQTYSGVSTTITVVTNPGSLTVDVLYDGGTILPVNAGNYQVTATLNEENWEGSASNTLTIEKAVLTMTAVIKVIKEEDPEPEYTATFDGFVNGEDEDVLSNLSFFLTPEYTGSAGSYNIIPSAVVDNYVIIPENGVLYVNPYGPGTKHIKPSLICIEELVSDSLGFSYIAHFEYENNNDEDVFIFRGDDNKLSSIGEYYGDIQPELFISGGGTFDVLFDGKKLTWTVASYNHNGQKTSVASQASSKSSKCNKSEVIETEEEKGGIEEITAYKVYPNPATNRVFIDLNSASVFGKDIIVYDQFGRSCNVHVNQTDGKLLDLDISPLSAGIYFIRVNLGDTIEVFRIIKY